MALSKTYPIKRQTAVDYHRRVERVIDLIRADPARPVSVRELAAHAPFSKFHFHRVFKAMTGETIAQCIIRLRLEAATQALAYQPKTSLTQIALECGFSGSAHFSKAFRKVYGCTPTQFRKDHPTGFRMRRIGKDRDETAPYVEDMNVTVDIRPVPERTLASLRLVGPYTHTGISSTYAELGQWYSSAVGETLPNEAISITWSDPTLAEQETLRLDACYEVPEGTAVSGRVALRKLGGGRTACVDASLAVSDMHLIAGLWDWLFARWLPQSGAALADEPSYEIYRRTEDQTGFDVTLCLPLIDPNADLDHD
ncbi:AraC family transcriptional regulator [Roseobacter cerasinus]|uniref:AraC family transcriptional regulator n=1 Tax=Roseobacter cerasinus TaxID=2602289 RepID=A0A640VWY2_9RHOB|nr:AraC family transcriptional regulator [Roseobacter cerasinus]GFE51880.1 AraC family transcriptional regulator [Roseobacter cerasinus]